MIGSCCYARKVLIYNDEVAEHAICHSCDYADRRLGRRLFIGVFYLRKQMEKMQSDPQMLQKMAKQMGYNLNNRQMQKAQQMMKNNPQFSGKKKPGGGKRK